MINPRKSMGPGRDWIWDPWICSQTLICSQTPYLPAWYKKYLSSDAHFQLHLGDTCTLVSLHFEYKFWNPVWYVSIKIIRRDLIGSFIIEAMA